MSTTAARHAGAAAEPWLHDVDDVLDALGSGHDGISEQAAAERLDAYGRNELPQPTGTGAAQIALRQFASPLIYILLAAAAIALAVGESVDAAVIAFVLAFNATVGFLQEHRAERSLEALRKLTAARTRVVRAHREIEVHERDVVPGDVVLLDAGDRVPADARVIGVSAAETDESLLTGESATVAKSPQTLAGEVPVAERINMLFSGSVLTRGRCRAVITATGPATELGAIAGSLREVATVTTPLQQRMARFARIIGAAILLVAALGFLAGLAHGESVTDLFLAVVALAVSAIPEGLPIVLTVALAISVRRMVAAQAVVRRLPAVESLGSCTVILSDKTGTLTQNRMAVERIFAGGRDYGLSGDAHALRGAITLEGSAVSVAGRPALEQTLLVGALCNEATVSERDGGLDAHGDPTEVALLVAAAKAGIHKADMEERLPRWAEIPFEPSRRYAATFHERDGRRLVLVKGSPEQVLQMSASVAGEGPRDGEASVAGESPPEGAASVAGESPPDGEAILRRAHELAAEGLRVLAMAGREIDHAAEITDPQDALRDLTFFGLQAMIDPPREEARTAVASCRAAGIRVMMLTGDHASTALAIARELGIAAAGETAISGTELETLGDLELDERLASVNVYARVAPEHKLRVVGALRRRGEVVAVTGDGVNDAPALKSADIGTAMGSGTDVAKEASDIVLLDDNFATIFAAVREGRVAFENVRKTTFYLISSGVAEVAAVLATLFGGIALPFLPVQLLWLNLVTNGVQDVALAFEPGEPGVARRRPRPPKEGIISKLLWERTVIAGAVMAAGTMALFLTTPHAGASLEHARTLALTTMVVFQAVHVGNARSEHRSAFAKSPFSNPILLIGTAVAVAVHVGAMYFGPTRQLLHIEPLDLATWGLIVAVSLSVTATMELHKLLRGSRSDPTDR